MDASEDLVHCPICDTEYASGVSICPDDGSLLVAGPAPDGTDDEDDVGGGEAREATDLEGGDVAPGRIDVVRIESSDDAGAAGTDLFEQEEHPARIRLVVMANEDAPDLIEALAAEAIGARLGDPSPDDGVEVIVHDFQLAQAQAVLVEFTGDPTLVDDVELDSSASDRDDLVQVFDGWSGAVAAAADRMSTAGIDVRLELATTEDGTQMGSLWVAPEDLDDARDALGIQR
jgi:hypothetical protein